jgi:hypothetical protein
VEGGFVQEEQSPVLQEEKKVPVIPARQRMMYRNRRLSTTRRLKIQHNLPSHAIQHG